LHSTRCDWAEYCWPRHKWCRLNSRPQRQRSDIFQGGVQDSWKRGWNLNLQILSVQKNYFGWWYIPVIRADDIRLGGRWDIGNWKLSNESRRKNK
jgi:hypothetical protein